ncbi:hypothetical protein NLJ89_g3568 [Agrocybe chaxingu]|uniref:Protein kinase domain-containing protein n=1 Tax=Agrocybe chaxingu TaxID=84603 RepID=A0A9W8K4D2_9AGAR|nr:hypothetical protein NLJ89_g3568 [Agrocybe chaxingu]
MSLKTPPKNPQAQALLTGTPLERKSTSVPSALREIGYLQARSNMWREIIGHYVGPYDPDKFFQDFMHVGTPFPNDLVLDDYFSQIPRKEPNMYDPLIQLAENPTLTPSFTFFNTSDHYDHQSREHKRWKPDISVYKASDASMMEDADKKTTHFDKLQLPFELKTSAIPFVDPPENCKGKAFLKHQFENDSKEGRRARGQIALVLAEMCARQYRTHAFMVFMNHKEVRFLRADRSAIIVTAAIDYRSDSQKLAEFLWRFSRMTDAQRGIDPTVRLATDDEIISAQPLMEHLPQDDKVRPFRIFKVYNGDGSVREVIGRDGPTEADSPTGRATRAFPVYDFDTSTVMFLKDTWRANVDGMEKESDILKELKDKKVRNVPKIVAGEDVPGPFQTTLSQNYAKESWRAGRIADLVTRTHHRFLEDFVGKHLCTFKNAKQLLRVVSDAFDAHDDALNLCGILHRDVSENNVMMTADGKGILNDWDLAKKIGIPGKDPPKPKVGSRRHPYRTGTWYFMSALLLRLPRKLHTVQDDLESFFYVILYHALQYLHHNKTEEDVERIILRIFDQCTYEPYPGQYIGGDGKQSMILTRTTLEKFIVTSNAPLTTWINEALYSLEDFHMYVLTVVQKYRRTNPDTPEHDIPMPPPPSHITLSSHAHFTDLFKTALDAPAEQWSDARRESIFVSRLPPNTKATGTTLFSSTNTTSSSLKRQAPVDDDNSDDDEDDDDEPLSKRNKSSTPVDTPSRNPSRASSSGRPSRKASKGASLGQ